MQYNKNHENTMNEFLNKFDVANTMLYVSDERDLCAFCGMRNLEPSGIASFYRLCTAEILKNLH
jgi:hypothetical protein